MTNFLINVNATSNGTAKTSTGTQAYTTSFKNPKKLFIRLRSYDIKVNDAGKKCWIVGNSNPLEYYIIDDNIEKYDSWCPIPRHEVIFREDEING